MTSDGTQASESAVASTNLLFTSGNTCFTNDFSQESRTHTSSPSAIPRYAVGSEIKLSGSLREGMAPASVDTVE